jgi:hypothetical protein
VGPGNGDQQGLLFGSRRFQRFFQRFLQGRQGQDSRLCPQVFRQGLVNGGNGQFPGPQDFARATEDSADDAGYRVPVAFHEGNPLVVPGNERGRYHVGRSVLEIRRIDEYRAREGTPLSRRPDEHVPRMQVAVRQIDAMQPLDTVHQADGQSDSLLERPRDRIPLGKGGMVEPFPNIEQPLLGHDPDIEHPGKPLAGIDLDGTRFFQKSQKRVVELRLACLGDRAKPELDLVLVTVALPPECLEISLFDGIFELFVVSLSGMCLEIFEGSQRDYRFPIGKIDLVQRVQHLLGIRPSSGRFPFHGTFEPIVQFPGGDVVFLRVPDGKAIVVPVRRQTVNEYVCHHAEEVDVPVERGGELVLEKILRQLFGNAAHLFLECAHRLHLGEVGSHET